MKTIPNVTFVLRVNDANATTVSLLTACLQNPPPGGLDYAQIRARNRVSDAIEKLEDGKEIQLEDADHATAVAVVKQMRWSMPHRDLVKFAELFGI